LTVDIPKNEQQPIMNSIKEEPTIELKTEEVVESPTSDISIQTPPLVAAAAVAFELSPVEESKSPILEKSLVSTNLNQKSIVTLSEDFSAYVQSQVEELSNFSVVIDTPVASYETSILVDSSQIERTIAEPVSYKEQVQTQSVLDETQEIEEITIQEPFLNTIIENKTIDPLESIYSQSQSFAVALDEYSQVTMSETEKKD